MYTSPTLVYLPGDQGNANMDEEIYYWEDDRQS